MKFLILLLDANLFATNKRMEFRKKKKFTDSTEDFCKKWSSQLLIAVFIYFFNFLKCTFNIISTGTQFKWIYPDLVTIKYQNKTKQNKPTILFEDLFQDELFLGNHWLDIKKQKKTQRILFLFCFVLFLYKIPRKTSVNVGNFHILILNFFNTKFTSIFKWKKMYKIAQKSGIVLDFYDISGKNMALCHYGAYKTKGLYCKLKLFLSESLIGENFLNPVLIFFSSLLDRQVYILPLPTNSFYRLNLIYQNLTTVCSGCFSILLLIPPRCFVCGKIFF